MPALLIPNGHVPQHEDHPTWCVRCGTFDCYFALPCRPVEPGFDASTPKGHAHISRCLGRAELPLVAAGEGA